MKIPNLFVTVMVFAINAFAADPLTERLQRGLFEEEANHNLDAAIKEYQSVVAQSDEQRKVIATALFRLGECYRKLGRTNDAAAFYQRITRDFSEQEPLAKLADDLLKLTTAHATTAAGPGAAVPSWKTVTDPEQVRLLQEEIKLTEQQVAAVEKNYTAGVAPLASVLNAKRDVLAVRRLLPDNSSLSRQKALLDEQVKIVEQLLQETDQRVKVGVAPTTEPIPLRRELLTLQREMASLTEGSTAGTTVTPGAPALTQVEAEELARVKTLARNSPDLLQSPSGIWGGPLQTAAVSGHYSVVEFLMSLGLSPNGSERGRPPLSLAAGAGHLRIVQLLLDKGADVNAVDPSQETALMDAAFNGHRTVVELLLERGADVNRENNNGLTALHKVAFKGHTSLAELLLKRGCKPDVLSKNQRNLQYDGVAWPNFTFNGTTPLHLAVERGFAPVVHVLLKQGASAGTTNYALKTPLHLVLANTNICAVLLEKGADPNAEDSQGNTPLSMAIEGARVEIAALLLAKGADVNRAVAVRLQESTARSLGRQFSVSYPLHIAIMRSTPVLDALLTAKPDLEVTNSSGQTPLVQAINQGTSEMVESLLEAGADPNHKTEQWGAPLMQATSRGNPITVQSLLKHGANPNVFSSSGDTPLSLAENGSRNTAPEGPRWSQIAQALREHGASENLRRLFAIDYTRPSWTAPGPKMFHRGTNDYNRHTLFEFLAAVFNENRRPAFPDLAHVNIERLEGTNAKPKQITLNIESLLLATNCSNNLWLEWGDRVSFPELDHPLNSGWPGFSQQTHDFLSRCLERRVQIIVKQETNTVRLVQNMDAFPTVSDTGNDVNPGLVVLNVNGATFNVGAVANPTPAPEKVLATFRLKEVVYGANVLRASSDPTRVRVSRFDPVTHKPQTWVIDLTKVATSSEWGNNSERQGKLWNLHDLWLRDGDVIEVPEKP